MNSPLKRGRSYLVRRKWPEMYCVYPHGLKNLKDFLKFAYFFVRVFLEPLYQLKKMRGIFWKTLVYPLLIIVQIAWRCGMIIQYITRDKRLARHS
jgi:hypothetical protein